MRMRQKRSEEICNNDDMAYCLDVPNFSIFGIVVTDGSLSLFCLFLKWAKVVKLGLCLKCLSNLIRLKFSSSRFGLVHFEMLL